MLRVTVWCCWCWYWRLQDQAETWVTSASQFVEDEETDFTACRSDQRATFPHTHSTTQHSMAWHERTTLLCS
jgi:hypothetical protein